VRRTCSAGADLDDLPREVRADAGVRALIDRLWPVLTPQRLLDLLKRGVLVVGPNATFLRYIGQDRCCPHSARPG